MVADDDDRSRYYIRAVERVCDLLDLLRESDHAVTLPEAARATGLPKSSAFRYLVTLEARDYALRDPASGAYLPGLHSQAQHLDALRAVLRPHLVALRDRLGESVVLGILDGDRPLHLEAVETRKTIRVRLRDGRREHLHRTALGRALLAQLPDDVVLSLVRSGAADIGAAAARWLLGELDAVRRRGWAFVAGDVTPDANAVGVPLPGRRPAAIAVVAPSSRLPSAEAADVARVVVEVAGLLTAQSQRARGN